MLRATIDSSIRFRLLLILGAAVLMVVGVSQLRKAPADVLPEFGQPTVQIQTESLGLSAPEVEQLITVPMESNLINGVPGVESVRSDSIPSLSLIELKFNRGTDILHARQLVQERLSQSPALPSVAQAPQMLQPVSSTPRVMMVGLSTNRLSDLELSVLARWTIRPRLLGLPGVANVAIWGLRDRQLQVQVDPNRLREHGLTLAQIIKSTGNAQLVSPLTYLDASTPGSGGFIDGPAQRLSVQHILPFGTPGKLAQVPIDGAHGLRLGDVSQVVEGHPPLVGDGVVHSGRGLLLAVDKRPGASTLAVTRELQNALEDMAPGLRGVHIDSSIFRPAVYMHRAIDHLTLLVIIAGVLAAFAIAAFLLHLRTALVAVVSILASFMAAALVLDAFGQTMNALAFAGLLAALTVIVDDATGDAHNVLRRIRENREAGGSEPARAIVRQALREMRAPLCYATVIILLAVVPVLVAEGLTASFLHPLVVAYALAVLVSMVVALTLTPALCMLLLAGVDSTRPAPAAIQRLRARCEEILAAAIRAPRPLLLVLSVVGLLGVALVPFLEAPSRPTFRDRDLLVHWQAPPGTSLTEMDRVATRATRELRAIPGVSDVGATVGRARLSDQIVETNSSELWVSMKASADYAKTRAAIEQVVGGTPGISGSLSTYEGNQLTGVLGERNSTVDLRVYGQRYAALDAKARELQARVVHIPGVRNTRVVGLPTEQPAVQVAVNVAAALRHSLKPGDIRRAVATDVEGLIVGNFFQQQKVFDVTVQGKTGTRDTVPRIANMLIDQPGGGQVPLSEVASVKVGPSPVDIPHSSISRYLDVVADVHGRSVAAVRSDIRRRISGVSFPLDYHAEVLGAGEPGHTSHASFVTYLIAAELVAFLVLQAAFGSWPLAATLFLTLPLAMSGGVLVAFATGYDDELGALAGMLAVFALAVRQGVVLIARAQYLRRRAGAVFGTELVLTATRERLAPILTSNATVAAAVLPFAIAGDIAGNEIVRSMAVVILGGLVTSTLLTLLVVPALYVHYGREAAVRLKWPLRRAAPTGASAQPQGGVADGG